MSSQGSAGGLNLVLNAKQYEYPRLLMPGAGFYISIHEPNVEVREVFFKSLVASVGQTTRIAIEKTSVSLSTQSKQVTWHVIQCKCQYNMMLQIYMYIIYVLFLTKIPKHHALPYHTSC